MNIEVDPEYFDLLSPIDRTHYRALSKMFRDSIQGRQRNHRIENFNELLCMIRNFAQRDDGDDWKRCLVCGVVFFNNSHLAINTHQLSLIYDKCKSSINGALKHLGWKTTISRGDLDPQLIDFFPILKGQTAKLRQWSVRIHEQAPISCPSMTNAMQSNGGTNPPIFDLNLKGSDDQPLATKEINDEIVSPEKLHDDNSQNQKPEQKLDSENTLLDELFDFPCSNFPFEWDTELDFSFNKPFFSNSNSFEMN